LLKTYICSSDSTRANYINIRKINYIIYVKYIIIQHYKSYTMKALSWP